MTKTVEIYVIEQTKTGTGIKCAMGENCESVFFLPKSQIKPYGTVRKKQFTKFDIPDWLWRQHWQLCGREIFEQEKQHRRDSR